MDIDTEPPEGQIASSPPNLDLEELEPSENVSLPLLYPIQPCLASKYPIGEPSSDPITWGDNVASFSQNQREPQAAITATPIGPQPHEIQPHLPRPYQPLNAKRARLDSGGQT